MKFPPVCSAVVVGVWIFFLQNEECVYSSICTFIQQVNIINTHFCLTLQYTLRVFRPSWMLYLFEVPP